MSETVRAGSPASLAARAPGEPDANPSVCFPIRAGGAPPRNVLLVVIMPDFLPRPGEPALRDQVRQDRLARIVGRTPYRRRRSRPLACVDEPVLEREQRGAGPGGQARLAVQPLDVMVTGLRGDPQLAGYLFGSHAAGDE